MYLKEDRLDVSKLYFHGSKSPRKSDIEKPSTRYPFYITTDLHYSMAFATKSNSSVGGDRALRFGDTGYVYVIAVNPSAEMFDFRKDSKSGHPVMRKIFPGFLFDLVYSISGQDISDIYMFGQGLMDYFYPVAADLSLSETSSKFREHQKKICDFYFKEDLDRYLDDVGETHQILEFIFDKLKNLGYDGIITSETDIFNDRKNLTVSTDFAVGLWNASGFSISGAPLKYRFCKKINPDFVQNRTSASALEKAREYLRIYGKIFKV